MVGELLKRVGFSLQANHKTREGDRHPDRDAQFAHINAQVTQALAKRQPVISVDTKKELAGDFKTAGRERRPEGDPEKVRVHSDYQKIKLPAVVAAAVDMWTTRKSCPNEASCPQLSERTGNTVRPDRHERQGRPNA